MTNRAELLQQLAIYQTPHTEELEFVEAFRHLLSHEDAFQRTHLPGHITGSAWIIDPDGKQVLLTKHAKLKKWLQPGGHADGDENVLRVALREAEEETGLHHFTQYLEHIFDIDIHPIPARKDFPEHLHYDVRFLLTADPSTPLIITEESSDLAWIPLDQIAEISGGNWSMMRMAEKTKALFGAHK
jgi:8-oxo-dGTP pyrophosphatase MutT (NUDIX family)